jgi:LacI family transcriptional regulator
MPSRPTLQSVARAAGVSVGTASEALRGIGRISEGTRERVRAAAARLCYAPDPILASLAARHFRPREDAAVPAALLYPSEETLGDLLANNRMTQNLAAGLGYRMEAVPVGAGTRGPALSRMLFSRGTAGVILSLGRFNPVCPALEWARFSVVAAGSPPGLVPCDSVEGDYHHSILALGERLRGLGYSRIGLAPCRHPLLHPDDITRHAACLYLCRAFPDVFVPPLLDASLNDAAPLVEWVRLERPDALVGFHAGVWWFLQEAGFSRLAERSFAAFVVPRNRAPGEPDCSGMLDPGPQLAAASVEVLDQLVRLRQTGVRAERRRLLIPQEWHEGGTLRPARPRR